LSARLDDRVRFEIDDEFELPSLDSKVPPERKNAKPFWHVTASDGTFRKNYEVVVGWLNRHVPVASARWRYHDLAFEVFLDLGSEEEVFEKYTNKQVVARANQAVKALLNRLSQVIQQHHLPLHNNSQHVLRQAGDRYGAMLICKEDMFRLLLNIAVDEAERKQISEDEYKHAGESLDNLAL
jgi:DNA phosphorothioation-dependent restriction protein DptG